ALLLPAGESQGALVQAVLRLVPEGGSTQAALDRNVEGRARAGAEDPGAVGDVVVNRLRERVRLLEHHADALAELGHVDGAVVHVAPADQDPARDPHVVYQIVHAVEAAPERRLAPARGPGEGGGTLLG